MTKLQHRGLAARVLVCLAENGPTLNSELRDFLKEGRADVRHVSVTMVKLKDAGFIKTKVWLTPEGMEELKRLGLNPRAIKER